MMACSSNPSVSTKMCRFFANLASYREEIRTLILGAFHFVGKQNPQAP